MRKNGKHEDDASRLAHHGLAAEAEATVWKALDVAISGLDPESQELLNDYLNGTTVEEISKKRGLKKTDVEAWVARAKRELIKQLRTECVVRQ